MTHDEVKKLLFTADPELKREYDDLQPAHNIAATLIQARIDNDMTQRELAGLCGTRQSNISRLESGEANPTLAMLHKIAEATGTELVIEFRKRDCAEMPIKEASRTNAVKPRRVRRIAQN